MSKGWDRRKLIGMTALAALGVALVVLLLLSAPDGGHNRDEAALVGEARQGGLTVALRDVVRDVKVTEAKAPGRPIVLIDPGHGGADGGAPGVSGQVREKDLTLTFSKELRDLLAVELDEKEEAITLLNAYVHYIPVDIQAKSAS